MYRKTTSLKYKPTRSLKEDDREAEQGAAQGGEEVCPPTRIWKGLKTTSRVPSTSGTLPKHAANEYSKKSLAHVDENLEETVNLSTGQLRRPTRAAVSRRRGAVSRAAPRAGTGSATGRLRCSYAKGSPNKKTGLLVSIALQNFTSEAETKGKTNQKLSCV